MAGSCIHGCFAALSYFGITDLLPGAGRGLPSGFFPVLAVATVWKELHERDLL